MLFDINDFDETAPRPLGVGCEAPQRQLRRGRPQQRPLRQVECPPGGALGPRGPTASTWQSSGRRCPCSMGPGTRASTLEAIASFSSADWRAITRKDLKKGIRLNEELCRSKTTSRKNGRSKKAAGPVIKDNPPPHLPPAGPRGGPTSRKRVKGSPRACTVSRPSTTGVQLIDHYKLVGHRGEVSWAWGSVGNPTAASALFMASVERIPLLQVQEVPRSALEPLRRCECLLPTWGDRGWWIGHGRMQSVERHLPGLDR